MKRIAQGRGRREDRQKNAVAMVTAFRALSPTERLSVVLSRPGKCRREVAKLIDMTIAK